MQREISSEILVSLDIQSELNPPAAMQQIQSLAMDDLTLKAKNQLRFFEAKCLLSTRHHETVEDMMVECLSQAIIEKDDYILVKCNVLQGLFYMSQGIELRIRPCMEMAIENAIQSSDLQLLIHASAYYLNYLWTRHFLQAASQEEKRIIDLVKRTHPSYVSYNALLQVARFNREMNKLDKVVKYLNQALPITQTINNPSAQLNIINNLATVYTAMKNFPKAEEILLNGLQVAEELCLDYQITIMLFGLGNLMITMLKYKESIAYFDRCLAQINENNPMTPMFMIDLYNNYSMSYWFLEEKLKSIESIDLAIAIAKKYNFKSDEIQMEENKTNILIDVGEYESAQKILNNAIKFYKKGQQYSHLLRANRTLAYLYTKLNDYKKSYQIYQKIDEITDAYITDIQTKQTETETGDLNLKDLNLEGISAQQPTKTDISDAFVGQSKAHQNVLNSALLAAQHQNANVMIIGESGTGKEIIAQIIHKNSIRRNNAFIPVNIAALSSTLVESELFGHTRGAFTGADMQTKGFFLQADKGTLFLDEIAEMPYELQGKLLRVIETRKVTSVGSSKEVNYDSRLISATNQNLRDLMFQNKFRLDLFHRLNTIEIIIPPLRERPEDIEQIVYHYIETYAFDLKKAKPFIDKSILDMMMQYSFPGNVRELKNIIERMYILGNHMHWDDNLLLVINPFMMGDKESKQAPDEEDMILKALLKTKGKQKDAAILLNMSEATLYRRIVKYNLQQYTRKGN